MIDLVDHQTLYPFQKSMIRTTVQEQKLDEYGVEGVQWIKKKQV